MKNKKGFVLVASLLVVFLLSILMVCGMSMTVANLKSTSNDMEAKKAFYIAEAGVEEAKGRLHPASPYNIPDTNSTSANWAAWIGTDTAHEIPPITNKYDPLTTMPYAVTITHKTNAAEQIIMLNGYPIYLIDSIANLPSGAQKRVRIEATLYPRIGTPAALYTKEPTTIMGTSTYINGMDFCGSQPVYGVLTKGELTLPGKATIRGIPEPGYEANSSFEVDIQSKIDAFAQILDKQLISAGSSNPTLTGVSWGNPIVGASPQEPLSCSDMYTRILYVDGSVKLAGGSQGCGILAVDGNLEITGGFQWYGIILVGGSLKFSGGGERNVTGSILVGGSGAVDAVGGNTSIVYCSRAVNLQTDRLPLLVLKWEEVWG